MWMLYSASGEVTTAATESTFTPGEGDELWNTSYSAIVICYLHLVKNMSEWYFCSERCFESSTWEDQKYGYTGNLISDFL